MSQTTPDIRQLSTCCGKPLVWELDGDGCCAGCCFWDGRCSGCGAVGPVGATHRKRELTATEQLLLARIAGLEDALRWGMAELAQQLAAKEAENAELRATLANERGEGEAPVEGWRWIPHIRAWQIDLDGKPWADVYRDGVRWYWRHWQTAVSPPLEGSDNTARSAMRAASSQGADSGRP